MFEVCHIYLFWPYNMHNGYGQQGPFATFLDIWTLALLLYWHLKFDDCKCMCMAVGYNSACYCLWPL